MFWRIQVAEQMTFFIGWFLLKLVLLACADTPLRQA